ncbi:Mu transposase C-terminal domain-containing protein [Streptomyces sp. NBC_01708]|uniref:Mu transposase C-terminal domain-containing protein n=1 Tax=Streptomyces sp. NBC_01708 TaxID=2975915 RepID=UPI002E31BD69|nr:Mu transposase C-terminal domain-containing protein [Streptomyces sp. NBC_01708]
MREQYAPERRTLAEREQAKAEELTALGFGRVSRTTVQRMRLAYRKQGLWGLLDHRTTRASSPTGRSDERVVAAVREALRRRRGRSKGTINGLFPLINQILEDQHGPGAVPVPSQATLYRLVTTLARPGELPSGPVRQVPASVEGRAFTPATALRPGEQVQIDTTRLDVLALFDDGRLARPELTIAVDVATRSILAAVLCPSATKAVDAALLLAEMAVPHPARPTWPDILRMDHARALPHQRLVTLDGRLAGAAARPVVLPETIVVDRGKVFVSWAFTAACESLGISVQPAPPRAPTAKGIVERTFGSINALFCQHLPGYTGSNVTRRGPDTEKDACYSVAQLQDLLDEWLVHYHHRPHEGLRHPMMPRKALTPNEMWAALVAVAGYVPIPLTGRDYLELLPVRWQAITPAGLTIHHRTYDADLLAPHRGQASPVAGRGGKWEIHYNPHDVRQIWVRLPDGELTEIPWIHRDHVHRPFDERTWQHIRTQAVDGNHSDAEQYEASLADALDQLMRRVHSGHATTTEQALMGRTAHLPLPSPRDGDHGIEGPADSPAQQGNEGNEGNDDSIDDLDDLPDDDVSPTPVTGFGLYNAHEEADKW